MKKIFFLEDEKDLRDLYVSKLEHENIIVDSFEDFKNALDKINEHKTNYDLFILDNYVGDKTGIELVPIIKKEYPNTPIWLFTNAIDFGNVRKAASVGVDEYLSKISENPTKLLSRVKRLLKFP